MYPWREIDMYVPSQVLLAAMLFPGDYVVTFLETHTYQKSLLWALGGVDGDTCASHSICLAPILYKLPANHFLIHVLREKSFWGPKLIHGNEYVGRIWFSLAPPSYLYPCWELPCMDRVPWAHFANFCVCQKVSTIQYILSICTIQSHMNPLTKNLFGSEDSRMGL